MNNGVVVVGSSRSNGDSAVVVRHLKELSGFDIVDLKEKRIGHFDYDFRNSDDDFNGLFKEIVQKYEILVFVTPVYWYTMSGVMKVFFDRISDFLFKEKKFGRKLRGKNMAVLSCSNSDDVADEFEMPFRRSASYLGMNYKGYKHIVVKDGVLDKGNKAIIKRFCKSIGEETKNLEH